MLCCRGVLRHSAMVCPHVADGAPILLAAREPLSDVEGLEWEFGCGAHAERTEGVRLVPLDELLRRDPSAVEIVLHPRGTRLERAAAGDRWHTGAGPVLFPHRPSRRWPRLEPQYAPRRGEPLDASDLRLLADVSEWGFHVACGASNGGAPAFAFTVGLFRTFDHPEVVMLGRPAEALERALRRLGERVREGERHEEGDVVEGLLDGRAVAFRRVVPRHYAPHLGHAVWYHGGARFPALQAVWSEDGLFPWDRWFPRALRDEQPLLSEPEPA